jgi:glucose/arabinose dehydrogenase
MRFTLCSFLLPLLFASITLADAGPDAYYTFTDIESPKNSVLEVGGMDFMPDGTLMLATRRGDIWALKDRKWSRFATGLQEPLGLLPVNTGEVIVAQRGEITRITDTDNDGAADRFTKLTDAFGYSGNYHEYTYGPARDREGNLYITLNLSFAPDQWGGPYMGAGAQYRGWCLQLSPDGKVTPFASGLRSPNGLVMSPDGDLFATDNQGEFTATNVMYHLQKGRFYGHPSSLIYDPELKSKITAKTTPVEELDKLRTRPAVYFPFDRMGKSIAQPVFDTTSGKFGPFAGQAFVGDISNRILMRVSLQKVNGEIQGACYPFMTHDDLVGGNRAAFAPDGSLYVGITNRGWGKGVMGLRRLNWTGKAPLEIHSIELIADGLVLTFTKPVDAATARKPETYGIQHWWYKYENKYGGPERDRTPVKTAKIEVSEDGRRVMLKLAEVLPHKVYEIRVNKLTTPDGEPLRNDIGWYTVNHLIKNGE